MISKIDKNESRQRRHLRIRKKIEGTSERPRMNVYRSLQNIYVQVINDITGETIVSASTMDKEVKGKIKKTGNIDAAKAVGKLIAERALKKGIKQVVFDRGGYLYHGRIKGLADSARESGLEF